MLKKIEETIKQALPDALVTVLDPQNDGQHFQAIVRSASFKGLSLVAQHQIVLKALKESFDTETLHALQLKTEVIS